ncbi:MAG: AAA family ATPase, partial [Candidatus Margulisbacteria bacterium]|nr:AAA family ATPase [Candidatus Margulisiibacteriota bacterium]
MEKRGLPIGIQTFEKIVQEDRVYIDKTELICQLINGSGAYFLSRPRRFGKSLLISTLEAIFKGRKELFKGLWIEKNDYNWDTYPVIKLDLSLPSSSDPEALRSGLCKRVKEAAQELQVSLDLNQSPHE